MPANKFKPSADILRCVLFSSVVFKHSLSLSKWQAIASENQKRETKHENPNKAKGNKCVSKSERKKNEIKSECRCIDL